MSEENFVNKALTPKNMLSVSYTLNNFTKQQNTACTNMNNHTNKTYSTFLNMEENCGINDSKQEIKKKNCFVLKKINLKESKNNYYSKALKKMFFNPNHYLENYYDGRKIIIGKEHQYHKDNKDSSELLIRQNKKRKTINASKNNSKTSIIMLQRSARNEKSFSSNKFQELEKFTSGESSRSHLTRKDLIKFPVSDNELKLIYKEVAEREEKNKKKKINFFLNQTWGLGIGRMVDLQEKVLKVKKQKQKYNEKISNKIMNITFKERNNILMNEKKELLVLKTKPVDKELTKFSIFNKHLSNLTKNWLYNLRKDEKKEEQKNLNSKYKELIYYNKDYNKDFTTFNVKNQIRKKFFKRIKKDRIRKNNSDIDLNSFHSLYIQGKHLLNQEIKITKDLVGKKKKLLQYKFNPNEISSIFLARSNPIDTVTTPKSVINSMEIHKLK